MSLTVTLVVAWAILAAISSVALLHGTIMLARRCPQLDSLRSPAPASWPSLSVVVPASNEAELMEPAVASLLAQDYPDLEIVLVDDRSTDRTREIVDRVAAADSQSGPAHGFRTHARFRVAAARGGRRHRARAHDEAIRGRPGLVLGRGQVRHDAYPTLSAAVRGLEKNGFAQAARFSPWRGLAMIVLAVVGSLGSFAAFLPLGVPWLWVVGAGGLLAFAVASLVLARTFRTPVAYVLLSLPLGDLVMAYVIARAIVLGLRRSGLVWRGTAYPTELLRAGRRVDT